MSFLMLMFLTAASVVAGSTHRSLRSFTSRQAKFFPHLPMTIGDSSSDEKNVLNKYSRTITEPPSQGASQAMLYATGLTPDTINAPQVSNQFWCKTEIDFWLTLRILTFSFAPTVDWNWLCLVRRKPMQYAPSWLIGTCQAGCRIFRHDRVQIQHDRR